MKENKEKPSEKPQVPIKPEGPALQPMNESKTSVKNRKPKSS